MIYTEINVSEAVENVILTMEAVIFEKHISLGYITLRKQLIDILFSVANTGEGISSEHLEKIFDRFYRMDQSRVRKYGVSYCQSHH
ncbi:MULTISPECIES: ATP-binding protein [Paenibacillus]|uniref:ATP-binding protein n=1 Tax=Paenibacillus TaxID=44249 RepID=UPI001E557D34|nr:ATP-binding protein [Paenibacillus validus]